MMDFAPLILGVFIVLTSVTSTSVLLFNQSQISNKLSYQSKEFTCPDLSAMVINQTDHATIAFAGQKFPCMLPNLYKDDPEQHGIVDDVFDDVFDDFTQTVAGMNTHDR